MSAKMGGKIMESISHPLVGTTLGTCMLRQPIGAGGMGAVCAGGSDCSGIALSVAALFSPFSEVDDSDPVAATGDRGAASAATVGASVSTVRSNCPTAALSPACT